MVQLVVKLGEEIQMKLVVERVKALVLDLLKETFLEAMLRL